MSTIKNQIKSIFTFIRAFMIWLSDLAAHIKFYILIVKVPFACEILTFVVRDMKNCITSVRKIFVHNCSFSIHLSALSVSDCRPYGAHQGLNGI
jgi:hypothetical protein